MAIHRFPVETRKNKQVIDITDTVERLIGQQGFADGLCNVFVAHTTAALTTADLDPGTDRDILDALRPFQGNHPSTLNEALL